MIVRATAQAKILRHRGAPRCERSHVVNLQKNSAIAASPILRNERAATPVPRVKRALLALEYAEIASPSRAPPYLLAPRD